MPPARRRPAGPKPAARPVELTSGPDELVGDGSGTALPDIEPDEQAAKPKILDAPAPDGEATEETCVLGEGGRVVELDPTCPMHGHGHVEAFCPTPSICWPYGVPAGVAHAVCIHGEHKYSG